MAIQKGARTPEGESQPAQAASLRNGSEEGDALTVAPGYQSTSAAAHRGENRSPFNEDEDDKKDAEQQARDESVETNL